MRLENQTENNSPQRGSSVLELLPGYYLFDSKKVGSFREAVEFEMFKTACYATVYGFVLAVLSDNPPGYLP